jgi:hypothetical protein
MHQITKTYGLKSIKSKDYAYLSIDVLKNYVNDAMMIDKYIDETLQIDYFRRDKQ